MKKMLSVLLLSSTLPIFAQVEMSAFFENPLYAQQPRMPEKPSSSKNPYIREISPSPATGSSQAVVVDKVALAHTTQLLPLNKKGGLVGKNDVAKQVSQIFVNLSAVLEEAGSGVGSIVKINVYLARPDIMAQVQEQFSRRFAKDTKPAVSFVVGNLAHSGALVAMDVVATSSLRPEGGSISFYTSKSVHSTSPAAYVSVLPAGGVVYVSGMADKGGLVEATRGTLQQLEATLKHLGLQKEHVVQVKSFMRPMADVDVVEKEIAQFFGEGKVPPAVYVDWVSESPVIEIELIAASPGSNAEKAESLEFITPPGAVASPVYSKVSRINDGRKVYISGLYGTPSDETQAEAIFDTMGSILEEAGSDFSHLAKATYYVSDDKASLSLNQIRPKFYDPERPPAASKAMVKGVGMAGESITIDMIGVVAE